MLPLAGHPICALKRTGTVEADRILASAVEQLRYGGVRLAGVLQQDTHRPGRRRCDMDLVDVADGAIIRISEDRGNQARGCRLKTDALTEVGARLVRRIAGGVDVVVLNKFGKAEAEGRGLRDLAVAAVVSDVPLLIGVTPEYIPDLLRFAGDLAVVVEPDVSQLQQWLSRFFGQTRTAA
jgi:nucleoside-triphosphatase THEP1